MKARTAVITILLALVATGCNNFFHDLLPSDDDRIKSFSVPGQVSVEIGDDTVFATVSPGTDLSALVPSIRLASGATILPVTYEYASRTFGDESIFGIAMELYTSGNDTDKVMSMIRSNKDNFVAPVLDLPINFVYPVDFVVISARGTMRRYTVRVEVDTGEGRFKSFMFDKFFNPELVRTAAGIVDTANKTVTVNVSYPWENIASYKLIPHFETNGARAYLDDGTELKSGENLMDFVKPPDSSDLDNPAYGSQTKTLILKRTGFPDALWTLLVNFSEDPDTSRAIIDFRFTRALNPLISADYMAVIANSGATGTINATVYYGGARPDELRASFISPGTVTVDGNQQISGYSQQDFSAPLQYVVTSRVGGYVRTYTVTVDLVPASDPLPQISYFGLSMSLNPQLAANSSAMIDHDNRLIVIEALYDGNSPPAQLIPEFSATGTVTANGITQTSGVTSVNCSGPVEYTVTNPSYPVLKREYRVEIEFVRRIPAVAEMTTFSFYTADNPGLIANVNAYVNQTTGEITATLLFNTPGGNRTLVPRWSAQGRVESGGVPQASGESGRQFYAPQTYRVISTDNLNQKNYTVTVKEVNTRIYVRQSATGRNDGTNWQNAYRNLPDANADAGRFSSAILKEIWIAEGTYAPGSTQPITSNTSYIGGFTGTEASVSARVDPANRRAIITGDLGGGSRLSRIFSGYTYSGVSGVCSFEYLVIRSAGSSNSGSGPGVYFYSSNSANATVIFKNILFTDLIAGNGRGGAVYIDGNYNVTMTDCSFSNTQTSGVHQTNVSRYNGGAVHFWGGSSGNDLGTITISNCTFTNIRSVDDGGAIHIIDAIRATITNCTFSDVRCTSVNQGHAIFILDCGSRTFAPNTYTNVPSPQVTSVNWG